MATTEPPRPRASDAERDRVIDVLRDRSVAGQLSPDTFIGRVDQALQARSQAELEELVVDLEEPGRLTKGLASVVSAVSTFTAQIRDAWRVPRLPRLALPPMDRASLIIGRAPECDLILIDAGVSRRHAELRRGPDTWLLIDLGSMNGTWVNGWRVVGPVAVRPGDEITFGKVSYLIAPSQADVVR